MNFSVSRNDRFGIPPYRVVGIIEIPAQNIQEANPSAYKHQMLVATEQARAYGVRLGACDACGAGIRYNYVIRDGLDEHYVVGSECVTKTGNAKLIDEARAEKKRLDRAKAAEAAKIEQEAYRAATRIEKRIRVAAANKIGNRRVRAARKMAIEFKWLTDVLDARAQYSPFSAEISNKLKKDHETIDELPLKAYIAILCTWAKWAPPKTNRGTKRYGARMGEFVTLADNSSTRAKAIRTRYQNGVAQIKKETEEALQQCRRNTD